MTASLLEQGLQLMLIGMGTVFAFLTVLVAAMNLMSRLLARLPAAPAHGASDQEIAAIAVAIHRHRQRSRRS